MMDDPVTEIHAYANQLADFHAQEARRNHDAAARLHNDASRAWEKVANMIARGDAGALEYLPNARNLTAQALKAAGAGGQSGDG